MIFREGWYLGFVITHALLLSLVMMAIINKEMKESKHRRVRTQRDRINTNIELISQIKELKNLGWRSCSTKVQ